MDAFLDKYIYGVDDFSVTLNSDGGPDDLAFTDFKVDNNKFNFNVHNISRDEIEINRLIFTWPVGNEVSEIKIKGDDDDV